jgi:hypothetical protein
MRGRWLALGLTLALVGGAGLHAQSAPAAASTVHAVDLPAVSVSGVQPGPGLWKVSRDGHVMWILGLVPAMPAQVQWRSDEVAAAIAGSQELLEPPRASFEVKVGFFGKLFLLPSAYAARKNEDGRRLQDVLPSPLYQRWLALKARFIGHDNGIERWRPIFAAMELERKARKAYGLTGDAGVRKAVDALAAQHGVPRTEADYKVVIEHPRDALKAFRQAGPQDVECFARTLDSVEHDLPAMAARADAWAVGDLEALRRMPDSQARDACVQALSAAGFARQLGVADVPAKVVATWLAAARKALAANRQSFAMLPIDELLRPGAYLQALQADGYAVEAPDGDLTDEHDAAPPAPAPAGR